jgi:NitT/TauT family transport system substrate-binding protein
MSRSLGRNLASAVALSILFAVGLAAPNPARAADKVTLRLDWKAYGTHAPFAWALEKGLYRDEGIELQLLEGTGSATGVKLLANESDTFGLVDYAVVATGVDKGMPVKAIFGIMQKGTMAVITMQGTGIKEPKDLAGKRVATSMTGSATQIFPRLLAANRVNAADVTLVRMEGAAKAQAVVAKRVDAQIGFGILEAPQIEALGATPVVLNFADWGVPLMGLGLVANTRTIREQSDLVRRFVRASAKAWQYGTEHPQEVVQALSRRFPLVKEAVAVTQFRLTLPLLLTPATEGKPLGWMAAKDWEGMQEVLHSNKLLENVRPIEGYFTNEFVPAR